MPKNIITRNICMLTFIEVETQENINKNGDRQIDGGDREIDTDRQTYI